MAVADTPGPTMDQLWLTRLTFGAILPAAIPVPQWAGAHCALPIRARAFPALPPNRSARGLTRLTVGKTAGTKPK